MLALLWLLAAAAPLAQDTTLPVRESRNGIRYELTAPDSQALPALEAVVEGGRRNAERFFGGRYRTPLLVRIYPDRRSLTAHWAAAWAAPDLKTECWMVASGVAQELAMLSPRSWTTDACEHDPADTAGMRRVIWHEMVHVYHGQGNPHPTFDGMDDLGWLVEGVATLASGQYAAEHRGDARAALRAGLAPTRLADAWSGRYRYGVAASLVAFVDATWGRRTLVWLLAGTTQQEILAALGTTESDLIGRWRDWTLRQDD